MELASCDFSPEFRLCLWVPCALVPVLSAGLLRCAPVALRCALSLRTFSETQLSTRSLTVLKIAQRKVNRDYYAPNCRTQVKMLKSLSRLPKRRTQVSLLSFLPYLLILFSNPGREEALAEKPRGWSGSPVIRVTVVVDRAPGSKRLPEDVVEALRTDPKGTRVVILDDNPTAWEARAREHIWIVPQFDVRRPLTRVELDDELGLLERISERCKRYFSPKQQTQTQSAKSFSRQPRSSLEKSNASSESGMAGDVKRPKPQPATTSQASLEQPLTTDCNEDCSTPHNENGESFAERPTASESNERKSSRPKRRKPDEPAQSKRITRSTIQYFKKMAAHQVSTRSSRSSRKVLVDCDYDEEDDHESFQSENGEEDEDGEDPEWEQTLMACREFHTLTRNCM